MAVNYKNFGKHLNFVIIKTPKRIKNSQQINQKG